MQLSKPALTQESEFRIVIKPAIEPTAAFDTLALTALLEPTFGNIMFSEIHLFSYLSCLLSLYKGRPVSEWGYNFAATKEGSPFSPQLASAIEQLSAAGLLTGAPALRLSEIGRSEYQFLRTLSIASREVYLSSASASILALPVGGIRTALSQEPALRRVSSLTTTRQLLDNADTYALYDQFQVLSEAIGPNIHELMIPAIVWLTYLLGVAQASQE